MAFMVNLIAIWSQIALRDLGHNITQSKFLQRQNQIIQTKSPQNHDKSFICMEFCIDRQGGRKQILDGYAVLNSKKIFFVKYSENSNFYYIKSPKHGYANAYPAYPVPPPLNVYTEISFISLFLRKYSCIWNVKIGQK